MITPVRRALLVMAICSFGLGTGEFVALGLLPDIANDLDVSVPQAGNLISAYAIGVVIGAPLLTAASVRFPRKGLLVSLVVVLAVGNLVSAMMPGFWSLLVMRFLSGLPHGAFFGVAAVQAANLVTKNKRSQAMAVVFAGLTIANVVGVPMTTFIGQNTSWRLVLVLVAVVELAGALGVLAAVPRSERIDPSSPDAPHLRHELSAFKNKQIWLSLGVATIGGGATFATFSYIAPMMTEVAGYAESSITPLLVLFGLGMTFGNLIGARLSDRYDGTRVIYSAMGANVVIAAIFYFASSNKIASAALIFLFPFANTMAFPALQNRIISLAGGAPNLAAASMHAAFNIANSIGAWLGGLTIAAGWGYNSPNLVAVGLGFLGVVIAVYAGLTEGPSPQVVRTTTMEDVHQPPKSGAPQSREGALSER
ncbi:MFS transporter [Kineosporia mesophila]|uniref:MFS transporter n=1 Tax=Kineosporia mesophila TaxID=566012 RepID=A0ABP6ZE36_9ACTN|nr:MFS transporter [Kineosporia mesophila]